MFSELLFTMINCKNYKFFVTFTQQYNFDFWLVADGCDTGAVAKSIHKFVNYGQNNTESVAELFLTLLLMVLLYIPSVFKLT